MMKINDTNTPDTSVYDPTKIERILNNVSKRIEYDFTDKTLLEEALTHPSAKVLLSPKNNERLEFLGDSVLNLSVTEMMFKMFPSEKEGALTLRKQGLTCTDTIAKVATKLNLGRYIITNKNVEISKATLENTTEALIGAIFIDGGFDKAKSFVTKHWGEFASASDAQEDAKSALQAWTMKRKHPPPAYWVVRRKGPDHQVRFTVAGEVGSVGSAMATGSSKRLAEQKVAKLLLQKIKQSEAEVEQSTEQSSYHHHHHHRQKSGI